jgi:hypothetical protein
LSAICVTILLISRSVRRDINAMVSESRYKFGVLVGLQLASGNEVVAHLAELFNRYQSA